MSVKCGIVGLPNAGKSTIFNALTAGHALCAPYPFTTVDANIGMVTVPDDRLRALAEIVPNDKVIPASVEFVDIAGLVKGASRGEGLGNQFLAKIMETDAIAHAVRCFESKAIAHPAGRVDPRQDIETVEHELLLKDVEILDKFIDKNEKIAKSSQDKKKLAVIEACKKAREKLNSAVPARLLDAGLTGQPASAGVKLLTAKPVFYIGNIAEEDIKDRAPFAKDVEDYAAAHNADAVFICAKVEEELVQLDDADRKDFMRDIGLAELSLKKLISCAYRTLGMITFFTTDSRQLRAWTVCAGTKAPQAAGAIHSDFEKGFIRAEVIAYADYVKYGSGQAVKQKGLLRIEGRDYQVKDGDVIHFRFIPPTQHK